MKKCFLSAIAGALAMLITIMIAATIYANKEQVPKKYEHIDYVSTITPKECYVCSNIVDFSGFTYWGEDNVGIVNLNTFDCCICLSIAMEIIGSESKNRLVT